MGVPRTALAPAALAFVRERHLAVLATLRADGSPHAVPVGCTWDAAAGAATVTTRSTSRKAAHARAGGRASLCSVDGARWLTLEGVASLDERPAAVAAALERYADRYGRTPGPDPLRVVLVVAVDRVLSSASLR